jgi:hypothetical protein
MRPLQELTPASYARACQVLPLGTIAGTTHVPFTQVFSATMRPPQRVHCFGVALSGPSRLGAAANARLGADAERLLGSYVGGPPFAVGGVAFGFAGDVVVIRALIVIHAFAFLIPAVRLCDVNPITGRVLGRIPVVRCGGVPDALVARAVPRYFILLRHADVRVRRAGVRVACFVPRA